MIPRSWVFWLHGLWLRWFWRPVSRYVSEAVGWRNGPEHDLTSVVEGGQPEGRRSGRDDDDDGDGAVRTMILRSWVFRLHGLWLLWFWRPVSRYVSEAVGWRNVGEASVVRGGQPEGRRPGRDDDDGDDGGEFDSEEYRVDPADELYCDHDSTWEAEEQQGSPATMSRCPAASRSFISFQNAARDMYNYRHNYPNPIRQQRWSRARPSVNDHMPNLMFYLGQRRCNPDGIYIYDFHNSWNGDYERLEDVHTYIQWLFPLQEPGVNSEATPLTKEEIEKFLKNDTAKANLLKSYELMLDFYGITLCDEKTGKVQKAPNWKERFNNMNSNTHNNLRITRILKCLGTLGYEHFQYHLVHFFLEETLVYGELPRVKISVLNYFLFAVLNKKKRRRLIKYAYKFYNPKDQFVWCPRKIQAIWSSTA